MYDVWFQVELQHFTNSSSISLLNSCKDQPTNQTNYLSCDVDGLAKLMQ